MITPGYDGLILNPLSRQEGVNLTIALGNAHRGDDYHNADVFGRVLHFGGVNYLEAERDRDRDAFAAKVDNQVGELQKLVAPHIGKWAAAKHKILGVKNESEWELWEKLHERSKVMHTSGIILGVAGVIMQRRMIFDWEHPGEVSKAQELRRKDFRIGVILDTTYTKPAFCHGVEAPDSDKMLVPVRGFPRHTEYVNPLWDWQLSGKD